MLSIIVTSYKEPDSIGIALAKILDPQYSGIPKDYELITVIPDQPTYSAAAEVIKKFKVKKWTHIVDPNKGKPFAVNLALKKALGDILVLTDGDVTFAENAIKDLLAPFADKKVGGVTGRPVSADDKNKFMGYIGHLLADAAHHKRTVTMTSDPSGKSLHIVSKAPNFFVLSGYILAMRNLELAVPDDCLIEDAYLSYELMNKGFRLVYQPEAKVYVHYAKNIKDWYYQKLRSVGGYVQLWKYGEISQKTEVRSFWKELQYFWFPLRYAQNLKQLFWSLLLYPMRLIMWIIIVYQQRIAKKDLAEVWKRVESSKY